MPDIAIEDAIAADAANESGGPSRASPQIVVFSYHKTGTSLFLGIMTKFASAMGLTLANRYGPVGHFPTDADIVLLPHSLLFGPLPAACRAIRVVRDPRDMVMADFDAALAGIFAHFGFSDTEIQAGVAVAREEDINRMDDAAMQARPQIHSRSISKWRALLTDTQVKRFEARFGGLIQRLGYELTV